MSRTPQHRTFTLSDGSELQVRCQVHPALKAADLMLDITALAGEPVANAMLALIKGFMGQGDGKDGQALQNLLSGQAQASTLQDFNPDRFDAAMIGQALGQVARGIAVKGGASWVSSSIFAHTQALNRHSGNYETLSNPTAFNTIFTGEMGALFKVLAWVLDVNFGGMMGRPTPTSPAT